jgi:hypothetical protein
MKSVSPGKANGRHFPKRPLFLNHRECRGHSPADARRSPFHRK